MVDASVSYDKLAEQLSRECSRQSKMDKPDSSMSSSVRIGFVTIMTLLQTILIWRSTRFALEITSEQNMVGLRSNGFIIESDPVETLHHSTSAQFRMDGRTLIGIMAAESLDVNHYVKVQREVLSLHPNVCSLQQFQEMRSSSCLLVYTFVVGANEQGPSEIVNDAYPILASNASVSFGDVDDVTLLNIRENMNEGKSQTWFYYASTLVQDLDIDYVGKMDLDTMLYLDQFFHFQTIHLPPSPYNKHILVGQLVDKDIWYVGTDGKRFPPRVWKKEKLVLSKVDSPYHMYAQGGCYILSTDLVDGVVRVANTIPKEDYAEEHEDHDISTMAFISTVTEGDANFGGTMSIKQMTTVNLFWKHPLKRKQRYWAVIWKNEIERVRLLYIDGEPKLPW